MSEQSWKPLFRAPEATITKVLNSPAFENSRQQARVILEDPTALRRLAERVEVIDQVNAPLSAIADRVAAAVRFLRARAQNLDVSSDASSDGDAPVPDPMSDTQRSSVVSAARERLIVASLHYLVTPVDLVPDFRVGGYIDDVLCMSWVFGAAADELDPYLSEHFPQP